ncbi:hypothetical protein [Qipengyuania sp. MTN3-11]|uniref:hypothetical protein n=1 Tax=Qipengyuania sp. MTN3-11 TaxID=3056557 RepID=UPI0036F37018
MTGLGIALGIATQRRVSPPVSAPAVLRIVPHGSDEAYAVAPHAELGAVALHLMRGNAGDTTTPAISLGTNFGGWRIRGLRILPAVESDPETEATQILYEGGGSQQYALQVPGAPGDFGGIYHGFGVGGFTRETVPDLTSQHYVADFALVHTATIDWGGGAIAEISETVTLHADGSITSVTTAASDAGFDQVFLDMTMLSTAFSEVTPTGAGPVDISGVGDYAMDDHDSLTFRDPRTGLTVTVIDDVRASSAFATKYISADGTRQKLYPRLDPVAALGSETVTRKIILASTEPDPTPEYAWDGEQNGFAGFGQMFGGGVTWDAARRQVVLTRANSGPNFNRITFPMGGLTPGEIYTVATILEVEGSSASGGTTISVSASSNGGSATPATPSSASHGAPSFTFTAPAATSYLSLHQPAGTGSDNILRITRVGPVTAG